MSRAVRASQIVRGAAWAWRASRTARSQLDAEAPLVGVRLPPAPALPWPQGTRGLTAVLRRREDACLVQALVRQEWHAAHGDPRDVVVAVRRSDETVAAHAWLDGDSDGETGEWLELARRPAAAPTSRVG